jgi:hypothetical protein
LFSGDRSQSFYRKLWRIETIETLVVRSAAYGGESAFCWSFFCRRVIGMSGVRLRFQPKKTKRFICFRFSNSLRLIRDNVAIMSIEQRFDIPLIASLALKEKQIQRAGVFQILEVLARAEAPRTHPTPS